MTPPISRPPRRGTGTASSPAARWPPPIASCSSPSTCGPTRSPRSWSTRRGRMSSTSASITSWSRHRPTPHLPPGRRRWAADAEVMLCLGADFAHKNRVFALELVRELQRRHQWPGRLVLAGPHVRYGSSRDQEGVLLAEDPRLAGAVVRMAEVSEAEKAWLLRRAALVLYPTVHEGFGLVPFEAAAAGVPCLWAAGTALGELLPETAAEIVVWDAAATADRALALMRDEAARTANLSAIEDAASRLRWDGHGSRTDRGLPCRLRWADDAGRGARARVGRDARGAQRGRHAPGGARRRPARRPGTTAAGAAVAAATGRPVGGGAEGRLPGHASGGVSRARSPACAGGR